MSSPRDVLSAAEQLSPSGLLPTHPHGLLAKAHHRRQSAHDSHTTPDSTLHARVPDTAPPRIGSATRGLPSTLPELARRLHSVLLSARRAGGPQLPLTPSRATKRPLAGSTSAAKVPRIVEEIAMEIAQDEEAEREDAASVREDAASVRDDDSVHSVSTTMTPPRPTKAVNVSPTTLQSSRIIEEGALLASHQTLLPCVRNGTTVLESDLPLLPQLPATKPLFTLGHVQSLQAAHTQELGVAHELLEKQRVELAELHSAVAAANRDRLVLTTRLEAVDAERARHAEEEELLRVQLTAAETAVRQASRASDRELQQWQARFGEAQRAADSAELRTVETANERDAAMLLLEAMRLEVAALGDRLATVVAERDELQREVLEERRERDSAAAAATLALRAAETQRQHAVEELAGAKAAAETLRKEMEAGNATVGMLKEEYAKAREVREEEVVREQEAREEEFAQTLKAREEEFARELKAREEEFARELKTREETASTLGNTRDAPPPQDALVASLREQLAEAEASIESRMQQLAQDLYVQYLQKHEHKVGILKKGYETKWAGKVAALEAEATQLRAEVERLQVGMEAERTEKNQLVKLWDQFVEMEET